MADVTYRIIIDGMGGGSDAPKTTAATPSGDEISPKPSGGGGSGGKGDGLYGTLQAIRHAAPVALALKYANTAITTSINRVELRTGRATYQEQLNYTKNSITRGLGIAGTIVAGVATQNYALALAGATAMVDWGLDIAIAEENLNLERAVNNVSVGMANIRAGAGGDRYGRSNY